MKQLHNISNQYSGRDGQEPMDLRVFLIVNLWIKGAYINGSANIATRQKI